MDKLYKLALTFKEKLKIDHKKFITENLEDRFNTQSFKNMMEAAVSLLFAIAETIDKDGNKNWTFLHWKLERYNKDKTNFYCILWYANDHADVILKDEALREK